MTGQSTVNMYLPILWKQRHPHEPFYATVCINMTEDLCPYNFIPVQRIQTVCAHAERMTEIGALNKTVFIAIPLPPKMYIH